MYDKIIEKTFHGDAMQYGMIYGDKGCILIKVGQNGNIKGFNDKYLKMAKSLRDKLSCNVIVSNNPYDNKSDPLGQAIEVAKAEFGNIENINYIGISKGASIGARFGCNHEKIKSMILVNGPLTIDWVKIRNGIDAFKGDNVLMIYGNKDPSYPYLGILKAINTETNLEVKVIEGANHNFVDKWDELVTIIEKGVLLYVL